MKYVFSLNITVYHLCKDIDRKMFISCIIDAIKKVYRLTTYRVNMSFYGLGHDLILSKKIYICLFV